MIKQVAWVVYNKESMGSDSIDHQPNGIGDLKLIQGQLTQSDYLAKSMGSDSIDPYILWWK